jgi:hypothetical protein
MFIQNVVGHDLEVEINLIVEVIDLGWLLRIIECSWVAVVILPCRVR